jgi:hypothetical protein
VLELQERCVRERTINPLDKGLPLTYLIMAASCLVPMATLGLFFQGKVTEIQCQNTSWADEEQGLFVPSSEKE